MRKWAFFVVAGVIAVIGCGGGGDSSNGTTATDGNDGGTTNTDLRVTIPTPPNFDMPPGRIEFGFLTGQGRAVGDLTLVISRLSVTDEFGEVRQDLNTRANLSLGAYTFQTVGLTVPFTGQHSRLFETYTLDPTELVEDLGTGFRTIGGNCFALLQPDGTVLRSWPPDPVSLSARVFPGRTTLVPIFIDDSMFSIQAAPVGDPCTDLAVFDEQRFLDLNQPPLKGLINDYVSFDISAMPAAARPNLSGQSGGVSAKRVMVSGDNYAVAPGGDSGPLELLTLFVNDPIPGTFRVPNQLPNSKTPGTFTLTQLDPTDLFNLRRIVAVQGTWRQHNTVMAGFSTWNMVSFPNSSDGFEQEVVFFKRGGNGTIVDFYFGFLNFDTDTMRLYPVRDLVTGVVAGEILGRVTGQFDRNGNPTVAPQETRTANFTITQQGALPGDAPNSGRMLVFRI